ncbi:hypothetical protein F4001_00680, partial [Candidatus Poribacteria bacterium]|nr:hypothetical protein [Candidatus Poribacteria bacterium]
MSLRDYTTLQSEQTDVLASTLARRDMPFLHQFEPIADFEELYTFSQEHPTPIVFTENHPPWHLVSVAARIIEGIAISTHEDLNPTGRKILAQILLEHTEYLYTFHETASQNEKLSAGIALALMGCICEPIPQSELWRLTGFCRVSLVLGEAVPSTVDTHTGHLLTTTFSLANALDLPILKTAIDRYNSVLKQNLTTGNDIRFPLDYTDSDITDASHNTVYNLDNLVHLLGDPSPAISSTTELGIAAYLNPEHRFTEQLITMVSRRFKWIVDSFFYPDGFHKDKSLISQIEAISDFSRFLNFYENVKHTYPLACLQDMKTLLEKQVDACISLRQPDLSFPSIGQNSRSNAHITKLSNKSRIDWKEYKRTELSDAMPYTGYYVMRGGSERNAQYLFFDGGPAGKMGLNEKLSFSLYANGRQLITHKNSRHNRSTDNTILLIDAKRQPSEPEIIPDPDTRWITTTAFDFVEGWHKTTDYLHKRSIFYIKGAYFILHDLILGNAEHQIEQIFHLNTNLLQDTMPHIVAAKGQTITQNPEQSNLFICSVDPTNVTILMNGSRLTYQTQCQLPANMNVVLFPLETEADKHPLVKTLSVETDADVLASGFTVISDYGTDVYLISDDGYANMSTKVREETVEFIGEYLFLRGEHFVMLNGRYLKVGPKVLLDLDEPREYYEN